MHQGLRAAHRVFAPYFFMSGVRNSLGQIVKESSARSFTLAFIAAGEGECEAKWADGPSLSQDSAIASEVSDFRKSGGDLAISFGGANETELAGACHDAQKLQTQYQSVIDKYHVHRLDFDIEGQGLTAKEAINRRFEALVALRSANPGLVISFTLPAQPSGLTPEAVQLLKSAVASRLKIDIVNILTMDYGGPANPRTMGQNAVDAAQKTLGQLKSIGLDAHLGITPMIGVNDVVPEVFTTADARAVVHFAKSDPKVALLSMWSANRDQACPVPVKAASPVCSGIKQAPFEFTRIFQQF